jgi:cytochrome c553
MSKKIFVIFFLVLALIIGAGCEKKSAGKSEQGKNAGSDAKAIEAAKQKAEEKKINDMDKQCAGCHAPGKTRIAENGKAVDASLAVETKRVKKHPALSPSAAFKDCLECHGKTPDKKAKYISKIQAIHLESKLFTKNIKQPCLACHDMN